VDVASQWRPFVPSEFVWCNAASSEVTSHTSGVASQELGKISLGLGFATCSYDFNPSMALARQPKNYHKLPPAQESSLGCDSRLVDYPMKNLCRLVKRSDTGGWKEWWMDSGEVYPVIIVDFLCHPPNFPNHSDTEMGMLFGFSDPEAG
jgi:hypothetical protein